MRFLRFFCTSVLFAGVLAQAQVSTVIPGTTSVGQASAPVPVTVTITTGGTAASVAATTQGSTVADFSVAAGGTCSSGSYSAGAVCTASVVFSPQYPGVRAGAVIVKDGSGTVLGTALISGVGKGGLGVVNPGEMHTYAGSSAWIYRGDGMLATDAQIFLPMAIVMDAGGNMYIADSGNNRVRRVDGASNLISTVAGNGNPGFSGDGGSATQAMISSPSGLALDGAGNVYFSDTNNNVVRRIDAFSGLITTVAGTPGQQGYAGDGSAATSAKLSLPEGLSIDLGGNLYIGDTGNHVVRELDAATGTIKTVAGTGQPGYNGDDQAGTKAMLNTPWGVFAAPDGSLYIADLNNHRIRKLSAAGVITTVAGSGVEGVSGDGSAATAAQLNSPASVVLDPAGNLYITDSGNNKIRKLYATTGVIQTIVNTTDSTLQQLYNPAGATPQPTWPDLVSSIYGPYSLFFDQTGNLFIADIFENRVIRVSGTGVILRYAKIRVTKTSPPQPVAMENDGNDVLTPSAPVFANAALDAATTTCSTSVLKSGGTCNYGVEFAPKVVGDAVTGTVTENTDAANSPDIMTVTGQVLSVEPTTLSLTSSENPSLFGDNVTFTAVVSSADTGRTGTVDFLDGTTKICSQIAINTNGIATCSISTLALGKHTMSAVYSGDANNASATSPNVVQVVLQTPTLVLSAGPNPAIVLQSVTISVQASAPTGTPTGNVNFYDGATLIGTATLDAGGKASMSTSQLVPGAHSLTASYAGDDTNASANSNIVSEQINQAQTVTTLATSNASVYVGTAITFTANVYSTNGPAPTGTVTFMDGTVALGTGKLDANDVATFTTSQLVPGAHSIVANYNGDTDDAGSTSTALTENVQQLGTVTTLVSDANPASAGATFHLTASVVIATGMTADGPITGTVTFKAGTQTLGTANVDPSGNAVLPVSGLAVNSYAIVATYNGNVNYATSSSTALSEVVQMTSTTTVLSSSNLNAFSGKPVTFTATVTSATGGLPTSAVTFKDGGTVIGSGTLNAQGVATYTTSTLSVGSHIIIAVYGGDNNYSGSSSAAITEVISQGAAGLTLAGPSSAVDAGIQVTMTASLTTNGTAPTGALTLKEGATVIGTQNVTNSGTFTFNTSTLSIGTHTLVANYAGDTNNAPATSNTITVVIQQAVSTTTLTSSLNPAVLGQNVVFTATVTSTSPNVGGAVNFMDGTNSIGSATLGANGVATFSTSTLAFGQHAITAVYVGDTNHATSTSPVLNQNIVQAAVAALISSANPSVSGNNVVFTAKITGVGSLIPTGKVTFTDGPATLAVVNLDATGSATFQSSTMAVGSHSMGLSYAGDTNYSTATASMIETIGNADTTIALTGSANPAVYGAPLTFTAAVTSNGGIATGPVTFTDAGTAVGKGVLDANGVATFTLSTLAPGTHSIVATYAGDGKAGASASVPLTVIVKQISAVAVSSSSNPEYTLNPITFTAAVTNAGASVVTGSVTFTDGTTNLGTAKLDATGHAAVTVPSMTAGNHPVTVIYTGDDNDFASTSPVLTQGITLRPTTTTLTSTSTDPNNPLVVTLISVVHWNGTAAAPYGKVSFKSGGNTLGSAAIDATGVATMTITLSSSSQSIVASYSGDVSYAPSDSIATTITGGTATQFMMSLDPANPTLQSKQRTTINITLTSVKNFTDTMQFGCLGLPYAATCTFSQTAGTLAANGTMKLQLILDTGDPLGSGATASASNKGFGSSTTVLAFLPAGLLAGLLMMRRRKRMVPALLLAILSLAATMGVTGCSGLQTNGTPAGTYAIKVTAAGQGSGVTQSSALTLTVTQ